MVDVLDVYKYTILWNPIYSVLGQGHTLLSLHYLFNVMEESQSMI